MGGRWSCGRCGHSCPHRTTLATDLYAIPDRCTDCEACQLELERQLTQAGDMTYEHWWNDREMERAALQPNTERPDQLALGIWTAAKQRDWGLLRSLLHPDAELQTASSGDVLLGGELAVTAIEVAMAADVYDLELRTFEALDAHTALIGGETIHRRRTHWFEQRPRVWLFTFAGDLLIRSRVFATAMEAVRYHREVAEAPSGDVRSP